MRCVTICRDKDEISHQTKIDISNLEMGDTNSFRQTHATHMILFYIDKVCVGKIEYHNVTETEMYVDWLRAKPGYGKDVLSEFGKNHTGLIIRFKISTSPNESEETILRRMNIFRQHCSFSGVEYNEKDGSTIFHCILHL
jgi:hypothetical protein